MAKPVTLENARITFRNFEGREGKFNNAGDRSFAVILDRQTAEELDAGGWNVKFPKDEVDPRDPDADARDPYLQVSVGFEYYAANVYIIANGHPRKIDETEVGMLDWAEIENVDLVLRPYEWKVSGNSGIKAYLKSGYFTIVVDKFAEKYGIQG